MNRLHLFSALLIIMIPSLTMGQTSLSTLPNGKKGDHIAIPDNKIMLSPNGGMSIFPILSNTTYNIIPIFEDASTTPWFTVSKRNEKSWKINTRYWYKTDERKGKLLVEYGDGKTKEISIVQSGNQSIQSMNGDKRIPVDGGIASSENNSSQSIDKSFDGDKTTFYHSKWQGGSTEFPVTLTYNFVQAPHIDYIVYTPRVSHSNGRFGKISIVYNTTEDFTFKPIVTDYDCAFSESPISWSIGAKGIDHVKSIRFIVETAQKDVVSCAEMEFFQHTFSNMDCLEEIFTNKLCYELKEGIGPEQIDALSHPFLRQLGYYILNKEYDTLFRVAEYEAYEPLKDIAKRQKTSSYNKYENPTGIYFCKDEKNVVFADGIDENHPIKLIIKDFGQESNQPESCYALKNGMNVITPQNKGNGYISYYTKDFRTAPNVKLHFAMGKVNGYFDLERGDTDDFWKKMLNNACSDIMDIRTKRIQGAFPVARFKEFCPERVNELALNMDSTIYYERQVMGLSKYGIEPKNRQFARVVYGEKATMHADGTGAAAPDRALRKWLSPDRSDFEFWGFAHELGHVNQVRPGLKWVGCGETTNNIYSAWVQFKLGDGFCKLEEERSGIDNYEKMCGGRFNCYLEEGVRKGNPWQKQKGADYRNVVQEKVTVPNVDYDGKRTGKDTTLVSVNFDHFVKLVPLWQLQLYCEQAGYSPEIYAKVCQAIRTTDESGMTDGQLQIKFMCEVCDSSQLNFLPFFEKAGMLKPIRYFVQDYGPTWLNISTKMIDELKQYVKEKGYPTPKGEINYISALNWRSYKEQLPIEGGEIGEGCTAASHRNADFIKVDHNIWKNAVAFETYDSAGMLLHISMHGLGCEHQEKDTYSMVIFPKNAAYIQAVGWDGTRIKCYEKK